MVEVEEAGGGGGWGERERSREEEDVLVSLYQEDGGLFFCLLLSGVHEAEEAVSERDAC